MMLTIEKIHDHLKAGGRAVILSYTRQLLLDKKCIDYIRADGNGFRAGWPGKKSVYVFNDGIRLI